MIIGIVGKARSGKDTFAELLAEEIFNISRKRFVLMAYAQELKLRIQRDFDLSYDQLWGDQKEVEDRRYKKKHVNNMIAGRRDKSEIESEYWTPREIMQFIGTECFRSVDNNFWVKTLFRTISEKEYKNVIITDVRFPEEANAVLDHDGYLIKVTREEKDSIHGEAHASETSMDDYDKFDFVINNDGNIEDLRKAAQDTIKLLVKLSKTKKED